MKKVLLASTALVAMSGAAFAEMTVSGFAEMGIVGGDGMETQLHTDVDVTFTGSGTTDNGLTFGFNIDLDEINDGDADGNPDFEDGDSQGGESIFISGSFGTITMGDTDGAYDKALTEAIIGGSLTDNGEHAGWNSNSAFDGFMPYDGQIVRYDYAFDAFTFSASAELDDSGAFDPGFGLGVAGSFGDIGFGVGWASADIPGADDLIGISLDATFGDIQAIVNWSDGAQTATVTNEAHVGLAVGYTSGPLLVAANWGEYQDSDVSGASLVVNYDLGGGAEIQAGYDTNDVGGMDSSDWSLGLALSF